MSSSSRKKHTFNNSPANGLASQSTQQPRPVCTWSAHTPQSGPASPSPFPRRSGHTLTATVTSTPFSELFLFGGYVGGRTSSDLYVFSTQDFSTTLLQTSGKVPIPRAAHGAALIGTTLLICGGKTDFGYQYVLNLDSVYLLNLVLRDWTRVVVNGPGPGCRYNHSITVVGSKLFVFGGQIQVGGKSTNDMWALDLNRLKSQPLWESYEPTPGNKKPLPRCSHVLVTTEDHIIIFGGSADGDYYYNDTWSFNILTRKWTELRCTGSIPSPRGGHSAVLVNDVMYVFGGFSTEEGHMDDLYALQLSTQRWFKLHNEGTSPHRRAHHAMTSDGTRVFVLGGYSKDARVDEISLIHVFDTKDIKYPEDDVGNGSTEYHAKFAAPHSSTEKVTRLEVERQPSVSFGVQTKRDQRVTWLADELALKCALLEQAEANAAEGKKRAILELREHEDRLLAQKLLVKQRDAELVDTQSKLRSTEAKLDESLLSFGQQIGRYGAELVNLRAELEAKKSELEAVRLQLTDADGGWAKSKTKADKLHTVTAADLVDLNEDRDMYELKEDKEVMEAESASPQRNEKSRER